MKIVYYNQKKHTHGWIKKVIFLATIVFGIWSFFWLPYFRIKEIGINDPLVNREEIENKLGLLLYSHTRLFLPKNNFFLFPQKSAEKTIFENGLGVAEIKKKFPDKISIYFEEVKPKFLYCTQVECFYIDKNGVPYESAPFFSVSPIPLLELKMGKEFVLGEEFLPKTEAEFIIEFEKETEKIGFIVKSVKIKEDLEITTNEGWKLILLLGEKNYKDVAEKLSLLLEHKIKKRSGLEYVDMRLEGKAYYKLISN